MAANLTISEVDPALKARLSKFKFRKEKNNAAIIMKIDMEKVVVVKDEEIEDLDSIEDLQDELPGSQPRYVAYSFCLDHDDGRKSYPLVFIFVSPQGCKTEMQMMYAGSKNALVLEGGFSKVFEVRSVEELTEEWLKEKMRFS